ncbi:hypothetical protein A6J42_21000 [Leptospira interrogans serovar Copenhageni]|nr:hypothetical protein A6J42_21000 [Leptospira interrogans serovar Copenhageni]KAA5551011.1 hypothetical protein F3G11_10085 [Leptospira interrogans serovar Copenhageni]MBE0303138.1 hypothetical protein [Leptospira interrogans serovar Yeoncheon]QOI48717.1 hypothetical protein Lepto898_17415 [Leptospira interrogans serovar Icterohaemorrhagiae]WPM74527.1 hypothetical protein FYB70_17410 [Leptospira interrogans serovar Icterohaemorrhagiae]
MDLASIPFALIYFRTCPKTLNNLHDSSLEIFNKTQWFLQKPLHLVICELSSNSNIVKFLCEFPHLEVLGQVLSYLRIFQ